MAESDLNAGGLGLIPGLGRSPEERNSNPLQCSYLENPMDRGAWRAIAHGAAQSWTRRSDQRFHFLTGTQQLPHEPGLCLYLTCPCLQI